MLLPLMISDVEVERILVGGRGGATVRPSGGEQTDPKARVDDAGNGRAAIGSVDVAGEELGVSGIENPKSKRKTAASSLKWWKTLPELSPAARAIQVAVVRS